jgi:hypothetical protein
VTGASDTFVDGGGVFPDTELPPGARVHFRLLGGAAEAVNVYVEDGVLHVVGQYRPVHVRRVDTNHLTIEARPVYDGDGDLRRRGAL